MVDKIKAMNWPTYSKYILFGLYLTILTMLAVIAINTKNISNNNLILSYSIIGVLFLVTQRLINTPRFFRS